MHFIVSAMAHFYKTYPFGSGDGVMMFDQLTAVHVFDASPAAVFAAWLSPDSRVAPVTKIAVDARVGGAFVLEAPDGTNPAKMVGYFVDIEDGERISYTWNWLGDDEVTLVTVTFLPAGSRTVVEVRHRGFLTERSRTIHRDGWSAYCKGLAGLLA